MTISFYCRTFIYRMLLISTAPTTPSTSQFTSWYLRDNLLLWLVAGTGKEIMNWHRDMVLSYRKPTNRILKAFYWKSRREVINQLNDPQFLPSGFATGRVGSIYRNLADAAWWWNEKWILVRQHNNAHNQSCTSSSFRSVEWMGEVRIWPEQINKLEKSNKLPSPTGDKLFRKSNTLRRLKLHDRISQT